MLLRSSVVSVASIAPRFSSSRCCLVVPGIGTIQGGLGKEPGESDLRRGDALVCLGDFLDQLDHDLVGLHCLRRETGHRTAEIALPESSGRLKLAGKERKSKASSTFSKISRQTPALTTSMTLVN